MPANLKDYAAAVGACRDKADAACEAALRADGGSLDELFAATEEPPRRDCSAEALARLDRAVLADRTATGG